MQKERGTSTQDIGDDDHNSIPLRVLPGGPAADDPSRDAPPDDTGQSPTPTTTATAPGPIRPGFRLAPDGDDLSSTLIFSIDPQDDRIPLLPPVMSIGRDPENDIRIDSPETSRAHALLHYEDGAWHVEDLDSTNGTHVNFQRAHAKRLEDGDILYIGGQLFQFRTTGGGEADSYLIKISLPGLAKPRLTTKPPHLRRRRPARPDRADTNAGQAAAAPEAIAEAAEAPPPSGAEEAAGPTPDDTDEVPAPDLEAILPPRPEAAPPAPARSPWPRRVAIGVVLGLLGWAWSWVYLDSNYSHEDPAQAPTAPPTTTTSPVPNPSVGAAGGEPEADAPPHTTAATTPVAAAPPSPDTKPAPAPPAGPDERVQQLLQKAARQLAALRLTRPRGDNAADSYRAVLRLDPGNRAAQRGLRDIANRYLAMARRARERGDVARALRLVERGLSVQPRHRALRRLRATLRGEASFSAPSGGAYFEEVVVEQAPAGGDAGGQPVFIEP